MALQTEGEISVSDVATEFEDTAPHAMSEFYGAAMGVPSSGEISLSDFYGTASFSGGLMTATSEYPKGISASGASGTRTTTTTVVLPAGTKSVFFAGATLDNGSQTVSFSTITVDGNSCTRRANTTDTGEYTSNVGIWDYTFPTTFSSDTSVSVVVTMANTASASGGASLWMFISELSVNAAHAVTGQEGGRSATLSYYDQGIVFGVGQSGNSGGSCYGLFDTLVNNPWPGVDGSWGAYSRGYGYVVPGSSGSGSFGVSASGDNYAQAVAICSYELI